MSALPRHGLHCRTSSMKASPRFRGQKEQGGDSGAEISVHWWLGGGLTGNCNPSNLTGASNFIWCCTWDISSWSLLISVRSSVAEST